MAMDYHKFKVGQAVLFRLPSPRLNPAKQQGRKEEYEVVRLLPSTGSQLQYRIKGGTEGHERVVTEIELNPMDAESDAPEADETEAAAVEVIELEESDIADDLEVASQPPTDVNAPKLNTAEAAS